MLSSCWMLCLSTGSTLKYDGMFFSERNFSDSGSAANSFWAWLSEHGDRAVLDVLDDLRAALERLLDRGRLHRRRRRS